MSEYKTIDWNWLEDGAKQLAEDNGLSWLELSESRKAHYINIIKKELFQHTEDTAHHIWSTLGR